MKITDEMVDDGAKAIARAWEGPRGWDDMDEAERDILRRDARAALEAALTVAEPDTEWEYMVRSTLRSGPVAGRVIEDGPMDEETARVIAEWDDGWDRALLRRRKAGPWEPVPTEEGAGRG